MLRIKHRVRHRNMPKADGPGTGPLGRITKLRKLVTALIRHERIEGKHHHLDEARGYAELLIQRAQRHGNQHRETMELADYWLLEKDLIPKLFEVLAPRYSQFPASVTQMFRLPTPYPGYFKHLSVLELKNNPWPPIVPKERDISNNLVNVLLSAAKKDYRQQKYAELGAAMKSTKPPEISIDPEVSDKEMTEHLEQLELEDSGTKPSPS